MRHTMRVRTNVGLVDIVISEAGTEASRDTIRMAFPSVSIHTVEVPLFELFRILATWAHNVPESASGPKPFDS